MVLADAELSEESIWSTQILVDRLTVQVADLGWWWWVLGQSVVYIIDSPGLAAW